MAEKTIKIPDSDRSARKTNEDILDELSADIGDPNGRQTSMKSGKHSSVEKQAAARPESGPNRKPVAGATGKDQLSAVTLPAPKKKRSGQ